MEKLLTDKVAIVTGASRGIGRQIAITLAQEGAYVIVNYNGSKEAAEAVVEKITAAGGQAETWQCSVADFAAVEEMIKSIYKKFGHIDVLVNNAGISHIGLLMDMTDEDWDKVLSSNLSSVFYCCRAAIPPMLSHGSGRIINISSMWGVNGASCEAAYSASKAGVGGLTQALAKELARSKIPVNALACGVIDTEMNKQLDEEERAELAEDIPAGRFATPEEVAEMVWKLICAPEYLTGQIITFDGGYL